MSRPNRVAHPKVTSRLLISTNKCLNNRSIGLPLGQRRIRSFRNALEKLGIEYFLPTQFVIRQLKYRRRRVEVPVIKNLIFVRTTKDRAWSITKDDHVPLYYMKDLYTHTLLIVPNKQMEDFKFVMDLAPENVTFDDLPLTVGTKVQVVKGEFCGIEGELSSLANRTYVVIRIHGVLSASVKVPKSYLRILSA